jgi:hypothetical protein
VVTGFRPEFLDFRRGIRVGNLEDNERITRILKLALESRYGQPFITERYGRGVYWHWIGYVARSNREAKPLSPHVSFGCAKFFLAVETGEQLFTCGMQVERGFVRASRDAKGWELQSDWDWHRLRKALTPKGVLDREIRRLLREGFRVHAGSWDGDSANYAKPNYPGATKLRRVLDAAPEDRWAGFQLYYPMTEKEVQASTGPDLVDAMLAVFGEVTPAMNLSMQVELGCGG